MAELKALTDWEDKATDLDLAFGTTRYLPPYDEIPPEFKNHQNLYARWASALFYGHPQPEAEVDIRDDVDVEELKRRVAATLKSFQPKHEHKMAGVAYILATAFPRADTTTAHRSGTE